MLNRWPTLLSLLTLTVLVGSVLLSSCSNEVGSKTVIEDQQFEIPGSSLISVTGRLDSIPLPIDSSTVPEYDRSDLEYTTSVSVREITFKISPDSTDPARDPAEDNNPDNFEFVSELELSLVATVNGETKKVLVATLPPNDPQIASNTQQLNMSVKNTDIRDLIESPDCVLSVDISGYTPPDFVIVDARIRFRVGVGLGG